MLKGISVITMMSRSVWPAEINCPEPPYRSPWTSISDAPPIAPPKKAVAGSTRAKRISAQQNPQPIMMIAVVATMSAGPSALIRATASGVK
jgi:hypothetical protein